MLKFFSVSYVIIDTLNMKYLIACCIIIFVGVTIFSCFAPFPSTPKSGLPEDHTKNIKGFLHKEGYKHPFKESSGCDDTKCHQDDLDGGVAEVNGKVTIAPSCFQCHETLWEDDVDDND